MMAVRTTVRALALSAVASVTAAGLDAQSGRLAFTTPVATWMSVDVSPDGTTFVVDVLGDMYTLPATGGTATRLTEGTPFDTQPRFSPDGTEVAFVSDRSGGDNLWVLSLGTGFLRRVTAGDSLRYTSPAWSADGRFLIVSRWTAADPTPALWIYPAGREGALGDGDDGHPLAGAPHGVGVSPSPDGRTVWYAVSTEDAAPGDHGSDRIEQLDLVSGTRTPYPGSGIRPAISPDGRWLAFGVPGDTLTRLVLRNLTTGEERMLAADLVNRTAGRPVRDRLPGYAFTPDGRAVVLANAGALWRVPVDGGPPVEIPFLVSVDLPAGVPAIMHDSLGSEAQVVAREIRDLAPAPDGRRVAFTAFDRVWVADLEHPNPRRVTHQEVGEFMPAWSPDGRMLAFVSWDDSTGGRIEVARAENTGPSRIVAGGAFVYRDPVWSADGTRIAALRAPAADAGALGPALAGTVGGEVIWVPAGERDRASSGTVIGPAGGLRHLQVTGDTARLYAYGPARGLVSLRWDGTDLRTHLRVAGPGGPAEVVRIAPDGSRALAQVEGTIWAIPVPPIGGEGPTVVVGAPMAGALPATRLSQVRGAFPGWGSASRAHWVTGNVVFTYDFARARATADSLRLLPDSVRPPNEAVTLSGLGERRIPVLAPRARATGYLLLRGARAITMRGREVIPDADILINGARIAAIGPRGLVATPRGTPTIDISGKTVLPGFVDTWLHAVDRTPEIHRRRSWAYRAALAAGITAARAPVTATTDILTDRDREEAGDLQGPRILPIGPVAVSSASVTSLDDARRRLTEYASFYDPKSVAVDLSGNRRQQQWLVSAAGALGLLPIPVAGLDPARFVSAAMDGYPVHAGDLAVVPSYRDLARLAGPGGVIFTTATTPTLVARAAPVPPPGARTMLAEQAAFVKRVVEAGGRASVGSGARPGLGFHDALHALASSGMGTLDVLRLATVGGAEALGLTAQLGTIERGKLADLVILDRDPLADIRNALAIWAVVKDGRVYDGATLELRDPRIR